MQGIQLERALRDYSLCTAPPDASVPYASEGFRNLLRPAWVDPFDAELLVDEFPPVSLHGDALVLSGTDSPMSGVRKTDQENRIVGCSLIDISSLAPAGAFYRKCQIKSWLGQLTPLRLFSTLPFYSPKIGANECYRISPEVSEVLPEFRPSDLRWTANEDVRMVLGLFILDSVLVPGMAGKSARGEPLLNRLLA